MRNGDLIVWSENLDFLVVSVGLANSVQTSLIILTVCDISVRFIEQQHELS